MDEDNEDEINDYGTIMMIIGPRMERERRRKIILARMI